MNVTKYKSKYIFVIFKTICNKNETKTLVFNSWTGVKGS